MKKCLIVCILGLISLSLPANAQVILSLDFGTSPNGTESGFIAQEADGVTHSTAAGDITVSFTNETGFFSRGINASTNTVLHDDFVYRNSGATFTMTLSGPGIAASTSYDLTLWAWDQNSAANQTFAGVSGTTGSAALNFTNTPKPSVLSDYSVTQTFTSDGSGNINIDITKTDYTSGDGPRLNGLVIAAIPEPSSFALLLLGGGGLMFLRRRQ